MIIYEGAHNKINKKQKEEIMSIETITIKKTGYDRLVEDSKWLRCLEAAGVDAWDGIDEARDLLQKEGM